MPERALIHVRPLPYEGRLEQRRAQDVDLLVVHCTELPDLDTARSYGERELYVQTGTGASGHYYVDRDGRIERYVDPLRCAHHVRGYNPRSVGIELVNRGRFPGWLDSRSQQMTEPYPETQIDALLALVRELRRELPQLALVAGHEDLDRESVPASDDPALCVRRKLDPGPMFPWDRFLRESGLERFAPGSASPLQSPASHPASPMPQPVVGELIDLLQLERLEENLFRGQSRDIGTKYVFGGQVLGQALSAAQRTVDPLRKVHSLHAYFLRAGDIEAPIVYEVDRSRDGKSFSTRRVVAIQHGQPIFNFAASFQIEEPGFEHQLSMPEVPKPDELEPPAPIDPAQLSHISVKLQRWLGLKGPFEFRHVYPRDEIRVPKRPPYQHVWFRLVDRIADDPVLHCALLAYASDFHLIGTATYPHGISYLHANVMMASLDHAMWFHRPFRIDEWLLYSCDSPSAEGARGLARGMIYSLDGRLVASTAQEGLIRVIEEPAR